MVCIYCGHKTKTTISRSTTKSPRTWRRRRCTSCKAVFTSRETPDYSLSIVVKQNNGSLQAFSPEKLYLSVYESMSHRKSPIDDARGITDTVIDLICADLDKGATSTKSIINITSKILRDFDKVADVHYSAHHKS